MKTGRPPKWENPEQLEKKIKAFFAPFESGELDTKKCTITRLAVALDTNRETLMSYENKDNFSDTIKRAKAKIEQYYEDRLIDRGNG